jgi:hypothetical protein
MPRDRTPETREILVAQTQFDADEAGVGGGHFANVSALYSGLAGFVLGRLEAFADRRAEARAGRVSRRGSTGRRLSASRTVGR